MRCVSALHRLAWRALQHSAADDHRRDAGQLCADCGLARVRIENRLISDLSPRAPDLNTEKIF